MFPEYKKEYFFKVGDEVEVVEAGSAVKVSSFLGFLTSADIGKTTLVTEVGKNREGKEFIKTKDFKKRGWISVNYFKLVHRKGEGYYKK